VRFRVPTAKLTEYLLNPRHPEGGSKARFFLGLGFSPEAPEDLAEAVLRHAEGRRRWTGGLAFAGKGWF